MKQERLFIRVSKKEKAAIKKAAKDYESISAFLLKVAFDFIHNNYFGTSLVARPEFLQALKEKGGAFNKILDQLAKKKAAFRMKYKYDHKKAQSEFITLDDGTRVNLFKVRINLGNLKKGTPCTATPAKKD